MKLLKLFLQYLNITNMSKFSLKENIFIQNHHTSYNIVDECKQAIINSDENLQICNDAALLG